MEASDMFKEGILPWWHKLTWFSKTDESISGNRHYDSFDSFLFPMRIPDNGRNRNLEIFYSFFKKLTDTTTELQNPLRKFFKKIFVKIFLLCWATKRILFFRVSKTPVSSICEYIFLKKMNIGRKNTWSQ